MMAGSINKDLIVRGEGHGTKKIAFADAAETTSEKGIAIAFGNQSVARIEGSIGYAISSGYQSIADAPIAISILSSCAIARSPRLAVALSHAGKAIGREIAIAEDLESEAYSESLAVALGPRGLADGLLSISLGKGGKVVAREGGTIALAYYAQRPGHWETPHGCDPTWMDGDEYLSGLRVSKVGENGIRANYVYRLDNQGGFQELGLADERQTYSDSNK